MSKIEKTDQNSTKTTTNFLYDENGNLLKDASHEYIYDKKARLVGVDNNVSYAYNHENTRVSKTVNAETTHFIYDGAKLIGEYNSDGTPKNEYIYLDGTPLTVINATQTLYIHTDHLRTPRRLADENANIVWSWESKAFGESKAVGSVEFNLRFAGQYYDDETSTHYNINRDYDPQIGRYLQSDPIGFDGGVNSYGYVGGNPLGAVDEMGLLLSVANLKKNLKASAGWRALKEYATTTKKYSATKKITKNQRLKDIDDQLTNANVIINQAKNSVTYQYSNGTNKIIITTKFDGAIVDEYNKRVCYGSSDNSMMLKLAHEMGHVLSKSTSESEPISYENAYRDEMLYDARSSTSMSLLDCYPKNPKIIYVP